MMKIDSKKIGRHIGGGSYGSVYMYGASRALKIGQHEACPAEAARTYKRIQTDKPAALVRVYGFGRKFNFDAPQQGEYWVLMRLLKQLCPVERELVNYICDRKQSAGEAMANLDPHRRTAKNQALAKRMFAWWQRVQALGIMDDIHCGNVMKTATGQYKLVDLDSFEFKRKKRS